MKKLFLILFSLSFLCSIAFADCTVVVGQTVASGGGACETCATGLVQAFILDDGNADLDDWVGDNNLTLAADTAAPSWEADNDGLTFDGTNDYASYTPLLTEWQGGFTIAVLCNSIPTNQNSVIWWQDDSSDVEIYMYLGASNYEAYNRPTADAGRSYSQYEIFLTIDAASTGKHWYFFDYDGSETDANIYIDKNSAGITDSDITEYGTTSMDTGRLGSDSNGARFGNTTIYRVLIYSKQLSSAERAAIVDDWIPTKD